MQHTDGRECDIIGTWYFKKGESDAQEGNFYLFVVAQQPTEQEGINSINGEIFDNYGRAEFQGKMTADYIEFIKIYDKEAVEKGGSEYLEYRGTKQGETYFGTYVYQKGAVHTTQFQFELRLRAGGDFVIY